MLALRTPPDSGGVRRAPHCRTCGKPMKGHKMDLCQLRSPSEESLGNASYLLSPGSTTVNRSTRYNNSFESPTPLNHGHGRMAAVPPPVPFYPPNPISPEPSWEVPPETTFYRKNPYLANNHPISHVPNQQIQICRTASWVSTEKADSVVEEDVSTSRQHQLRRDTTPVRALPGSGPPATPPNTPPPTRGPQQAEKGIQCEEEEGGGGEIDAIDSTGKRVLGINFAALGDNLKAIIRQANEAGYYATIVRPRIGSNRSSVDGISATDQDDADKHTTIFVSTSPDTISINMMCSEAFRKANLLTANEDRVRSGTSTTTSTTHFWVLVFLAMFFASLFAMSVNRIIINCFFL